MIGLRGMRVQDWGAEGDWQRESNDGGRERSPYED